MSRLPTLEASVSFESAPQESLSSGIQSQIDALQNLGKGVEEVGQVVNKEEAISNKANLQYNMSKAYEGFATKAAKNPNAVEGQQNFLKESESYSQQVSSQTNSENKAYVNNLAQHYSESYNKPLVKNALAQSHLAQKGIDINVDAQQTQDISNSIVKADLSKGDAAYTNTYALITAQLKSRFSNLTQGNTTPAEYKSMQESSAVGYASQMITNTYAGYIKNGHLDEALKFINTAENSYKGKLSAPQFLKLQAMVGKETTAAFNNLGVSKKLIQFQFEQQAHKASTTGEPISADLTNLAKLSDPKNADYYDFVRKQSQWTSEFFNLSHKANPVQAQLQLNQIKDPDQKATATKAYIAGRADLIKNPAEIAANQDVVKHASSMQNNMKQTGTDNLQHPSTPQIPTFNSLQATKEWELTHGFTDGGVPGQPIAKLMFNTYSTGFVSAWGKADASGKVEMLSELRKTAGNDSNFALMMHQLHGSGLPAGGTALSYVDPHDAHLPLISQSLATPMGVFNKEMAASKSATGDDDKTTIDDAIWKDVNQKSSHFFSSANDTVLYQESQHGNVHSLNLLTNDNIQKSLQKLAYGNFLSGVSSSPQAAVDRASKQLLGNFSYPVLDGRTLRVPKNVNADLVKIQAQNFKSKVPNLSWKISDKDPSGQFDSMQAHAIHQQLINMGQFRTNSEGTGLVFVDGAGKIPLLSTGKPLEFKYSEMNNFVMSDENYINSKLHPTSVLDVNLHNHISAVNSLMKLKAAKHEINESGDGP